MYAFERAHNLLIFSQQQVVGGRSAAGLQSGYAVSTAATDAAIRFAAAVAVAADRSASIASLDAAAAASSTIAAAACAASRSASWGGGGGGADRSGKGRPRFSHACRSFSLLNVETDWL